MKKEHRGAPGTSKHPPDKRMKHSVMKYQRKTSRPTWAHPHKTLVAMATLASKTSIQHAADQYKVNWSTVRRACEQTGIAPRRRPSNVYAKLRSLKLRANGKTYTEIGRIVGYNRQSIYNWCAAAGVLVDRKHA